jgi:hypothetical protein
MRIATLVMTIAFAVAGFADEPMDFKVTPRKGDIVETKVEKDRVVFDVQSPTGIGEFDVKRLRESWPRVVVRLHLKGLEHFEATAGGTKLSAAVSTQNGRPTIRAWKDGDENRPLDHKSPHWPNIAVGDGVFEIDLPRAMFEGNPPTLQVRWIDFYRN